MNIDNKYLTSDCYNGSYKELIDLIGYENTMKIYESYAGQYITLPKKLYSDDYIHQCIREEYNGTNAREIAKKYNYTYSWIMKLLKNNK